MTKVSRLRIDEAKSRRIKNGFLTAITLLETKEQIGHFVKDLFSPTEIKMFEKRLQIAKMLLEGYKYGDIKGYVNVTDSTIAKVSNTLETSGKGYRRVIKKIVSIEQAEDKRKMEGKPLEERYSSYFLLNKGIDRVEKEVKRQRKTRSARKKI